MIKQPWWYPLARDPYGDQVPWYMAPQTTLAERMPSCPIKTWDPSVAPKSLDEGMPRGFNPAAQSHPRGSMDGARNATITEHPTMPFDPTADNPIPGAGNLRGFRYRYGIHVTGPCGLHHIMTASEARALAAWLMKMGAEEPT